MNDRNGNRNGTQPKIEDVARLAGVSTATVSRALNATGRVREETRLAVERAVAELGYTPNFGGQALASKRTNTIGAIIPTMENAIFARALQALQETLSESNVTLLVATSHYSPQREEAQLRSLLARGVDGLALIGIYRSEIAYRLLDTRGVPFVILWSDPARSTHVTIGFDNQAAARDVAERVIVAGHRQIAMISGIRNGNDRAEARVAGVAAAMQAHGLVLPSDWLIEVPYTLDDGEEAARYLLTKTSRPTAIVCANDVIAAGVLRAARELDIDVPSQLSVTGFDDIELARAVSPPLSTVHVPHRRIGSTAARLLMDWIMTGNRPNSVTFPTTFVARESLR
ncbi:LacI family DNA-binding transcriptional regulator [Paracoccus sp. 22332]|uniref:LacI family DNA-binding transcriptional regulator n=1 Tax=Paracoccus sp. 22332 TaxID=3453913 RepID=UPI003F85C9ED